MRNDIKLAAKVITNLDTRWQLWNFGENNEKNENQEQVEDSLEKIIYKEQKLLSLAKNIFQNDLYSRK